MLKEKYNACLHEKEKLERLGGTDEEKHRMEVRMARLEVKEEYSSKLVEAFERGMEKGFGMRAAGEAGGMGACGGRSTPSSACSDLIRSDSHSSFDSR